MSRQAAGADETPAGSTRRGTGQNILKEQENTMKNRINITVALVAAVLSLSLFTAQKVQAQAESYLGITNVLGQVTLNSSNVTAVAPVPTGFMSLKTRIKVTGAGTITLVSDGASTLTNVSVGGAATTNTFIAGGVVTATSNENWIAVSEAPVLNVAPLKGYCAGTIAGIASGTVLTGTVNTATVQYWHILRPL